jgi:hypothetical protein
MVINIIKNILNLFNGHCNIKCISDVEYYIMNNGICYYIKKDNNKLLLHNLNDNTTITI